MAKSKKKQLHPKKNELILPGGRIIKVGPGAAPTTGGNASMKEIIKMMKEAAKRGIFPPPPGLES